MLRRAAWVVVAAVALTMPVARAGVLPDPPPVGTPAGIIDLAGPGLASGNVEYVATIPLDMPGIAGRVVDVDGQRRFYVSGIPGISIYDVDRPELPLLLGHLPLPNYENEDVSVSADGSTVLVTEYTDTYYLHVIDTSNPALPLLASSLLLQAAGHTSECLDRACDWVYGSGGQIIDLRNKKKPLVRAERWTDLLGLNRAHAMTLDEAGILTIDTTPLAMVDASDPLHPVLLATAAPGEQAARRTAYQHNNLRPHAEDYEFRDSGPIAPGELILGNGETALEPTCNGNSGPFATWSARGFDRGADLSVLDVYRPVNGIELDGNPPFNVGGCSGHWFTASDAADGGQLVAAGWYEHGTRFLHVDAGTGAIEEVGFWQPVWGSAWAAYWVGDGYVYVVDFVRGIDILRFDEAAAPPSAGDIEMSWKTGSGALDPASVAERAYCRLSQQ
jgi:hypothetical protein